MPRHRQLLGGIPILKPGKGGGFAVAPLELLAVKNFIPEPVHLAYVSSVEKAAFKSFVEEKAREADELDHVDWEARKEEWLSRLNEFYSIIDGYLADFVKTGQMRIESSAAFLTEEHIGAYQAESRAIVLGKSRITLMPVGTLLIGARGRVDMTGPAGTVKFILTGKNSKGISISVGEEPKLAKNSEDSCAWKIATPPPNIRFAELTPENFFNALTESLNG